MKDGHGQKPEWLKVRLGHGPVFDRISRIIRGGRLHTVCEEAMCPNKGQCWGHGRATIMILGASCSRACTFCNVDKRETERLDGDEPRRVAEAVREMGLRDVVLTSVTRDDLGDGGSMHWAETVRQVRAAAPDALVEVLIPDFRGDVAAIDRVADAAPDVLAHNLETVPSLYPAVRPQADYRRSLDVLRRGSERGLITKTGIMLGLGERLEEVDALMHDALEAGCRIFYAGQYLQPTRRHHPVERFVEPGEFEALRERAVALGFGVVVTGPLVRSSYHSEDQAAYVRGWKGTT